MVFGFPLTGSLSSGGNFTSGLVSGLRGLRDAAGEIQITAPVQPGNSGGPLMDASGLVIGVVQAKLDALRAARVTGDIPQNVNFAISLDVVADFLAKNRVAFRDGVPAAPLDTARVAELAQSFTYRVECRGTTRQALAPPGVKPGALPSCPGAYNTATWTSCVGERTLPDGAKYVGEFRDGKSNGQGTYTWSSGQIYVGEWKDGKQHGQGTMTFAGGDKYVGEWKDGKRHGQGTTTLADGHKYVGEWKDGNPHGQGTLTRPDGSVIYSGMWADNKPVPSQASPGGGLPSCPGAYNATWTNCIAEATYPGGHKYAGEFQHGKPHGQGTYTWPSGQKYVGEWKDGKRHGQGTSYGTDGSISLSGTWENDSFIGRR